MSRCTLLILLPFVTACGLLFPPDPIDFRKYELSGVAYPEAVSIVRDVVAREFTRLFGGGFSIDWDSSQGNLHVEGVGDGSRQLEVYIKVVPRGDDTVLEMFALVKHVDPSPEPGKFWTKPMQDVPLEEVLYDAFIVESVDRRSAGS